MKISVTEAKAHLTDLVRRAEAGEDVILTRRGQPAVRIVRLSTIPTGATRRALLEKLRTLGAAKANRGPTAERSQDFLYDDDGLPA